MAVRWTTGSLSLGLLRMAPAPVAISPATHHGDVHSGPTHSSGLGLLRHQPGAVPAEKKTALAAQSPGSQERKSLDMSRAQLLLLDRKVPVSSAYGEGDPCCICFGAEEEAKIALLPCGHSLHAGCYRSASAASASWDGSRGWICTDSTLGGRLRGSCEPGTPPAS